MWNGEDNISEANREKSYVRETKPGNKPPVLDVTVKTRPQLLSTVTGLPVLKPNKKATIKAKKLKTNEQLNIEEKKKLAMEADDDLVNSVQQFVEGEEQVPLSMKQKKKLLMKEADEKSINSSEDRMTIYHRLLIEMKAGLEANKTAATADLQPTTVAANLAASAFQSKAPSMTKVSVPGSYSSESKRLERVAANLNVEKKYSSLATGNSRKQSSSPSSKGTKVPQSHSSTSTVVPSGFVALSNSKMDQVLMKEAAKRAKESGQDKIKLFLQLRREMKRRQLTDKVGSSGVSEPNPKCQLRQEALLLRNQSGISYQQAKANVSKQSVTSADSWYSKKIEHISENTGIPIAQVRTLYPDTTNVKPQENLTETQVEKKRSRTRKKKNNVVVMSTDPPVKKEQLAAPLKKPNIGANLPAKSSQKLLTDTKHDLDRVTKSMSRIAINFGPPSPEVKALKDQLASTLYPLSSSDPVSSKPRALVKVEAPDPKAAMAPFKPNSDTSVPKSVATKTTTVTATKTKTITVTKTETVPLIVGSGVESKKLNKTGTEKQILKEFKDCVTRVNTFKEVEQLVARAKKLIVIDEKVRPMVLNGGQAQD